MCNLACQDIHAMMSFLEKSKDSQEPTLIMLVCKLMTQNTHDLTMIDQYMNFICNVIADDDFDFICNVKETIFNYLDLSEFIWKLICREDFKLHKLPKDFVHNYVWVFSNMAKSKKLIKQDKITQNIINVLTELIDILVIDSEREDTLVELLKTLAQISSINTNYIMISGLNY